MKKTYNVTVEPGEKMWVLVCSDIHLVSQCHTLGDIEKEMIPLIAEIEELPEESIELNVQYVFPQKHFPLQSQQMTVESFKSEEEATRFATDFAMDQVVNVDNLAEHGFSAEEIEDMRATVRYLKETGNLPPASKVVTEFINPQEEMVPTTTKFTRSQRDEMDAG